jgi:formylglycine-generating enzyme required for sulfatase activity
MRGSRVGLVVASIAVAAAVRPAVGGDCEEKDRDARGRCPPKPPEQKAGSGSAAPRRVVTPPPAKKTQLDIRGADIAGVEVSLDGQVTGRGPLILNTAPARHLVEVKKDGYVPYAEWVEVKQGERKLVEVKLQALKPPPAAAKATRPAASPASCSEGMVRVPAGTFQMGSPEGVGDGDEHPPHAVTLPAYCIDRTEVTVAAYAACVAAKECAAAPLTVQWSGYSEEDVKRWSRFCNRADRTNHPINCVDWNQAAAYCKWAGKRLPTEAEWEYAARHDPKTGKNHDYPWGNEVPSAKRLNACDSECVAMGKRDLKLDWKAMYDARDGWETTAPVGTFPDGASPVGALDMAGNVWEWTADWYGSYSGAAVTNPQGAKTGTYRVSRGGSWRSDDAAWVRAAVRDRNGPSYRNNTVGFRCVRGD